MDVLFRRPGFHRYASEQPAWHLLVSGGERASRGVVAQCGYTYDNIFEELKFRKSKTKPPRRELCARCFPEAAQKRKQKKDMVNLSEFVTGAADIKPSEGDFTQPDDGTYEYEITKIGVHKGPKAPSIFIDYRLDNGQNFREWHGLPAKYGEETQKERDSIARYLARLVSLGVPAETVNTFSDTDSLVGWRGVFDLVSTKGKAGTANAGKTYKNIRNLRQGASKSAERRPADAGFIAAPTAAPAAPAQPVQQVVQSSSTGPGAATNPPNPAAAASDEENPFGD